ncbi:YoaK family protein [Streptomyces triculaminicus]|uniref:YoaK family protein n=1 Tax=Streptomyces triculaminicus TaxID=2816232 RepID=UPI0033E01815
MRPAPGAALTTAMVALTLTTGMVEAVSFLVLGPVFTAVQTGNLLFLGFAIAGEGGLSPTAALASLGGFAVGVVFGARSEAREEAGGHRWFAWALVTEAVVLAAGAVVAWDLQGAGGALTARHYAVTAVVAAAMGARNVTTMRVRVPDLPTTLATRAMTALLSGSPVAPAPRPLSALKDQGRRAASVGAMFVGGLLGAWMLHAAVRPALVLLTAAVGVLATAAAYATRARHLPT